MSLSSYCCVIPVCKYCYIFIEMDRVVIIDRLANRHLIACLGLGRKDLHFSHLFQPCLFLGQETPKWKQVGLKEN